MVQNVLFYEVDIINEVDIQSISDKCFPTEWVDIRVIQMNVIILEYPLMNELKLGCPK